MDQLRNKRCKSNASKANENALEGLISQEFMRQLDSNFMAQKEERIEGWQRSATRSRIQRNTPALATTPLGDYSTAQKPLRQSFSPITNRADEARQHRFQQTHTAKRKNDRSQELYRTHFNLEHPVERSVDRAAALQGHKEGPALALGAKKQRNPLIRDVFRSQVTIN